MLRRHILMSLLAMSSIAVMHGGAGAWEFDDPEPFVRALYEREIARHNSGGTPSEAEFLALFTRETRALILAGRRNKAMFPPGEVLNVFFGWGVLPGQPVELKDVWNYRGRHVLMIVVDLTVHGESRKAYVHAVRQDGRWRISSIAYDEGDDFASYWRKRAGQ
jgi:hypothetical protein